MVSAEIFGISFLVSYHDCDKQTSYEYCEEGTMWFHDHCKAAHQHSVLALSWLTTYDIYKRSLVC